MLRRMVLGASAALATAAACAPRWDRRGHFVTVSPAPTCPRSARRGPSERCICTDGQMSLLGACVSPAVADRFCGPGAHLGFAGCSFRVCPSGQRLDIASGDCVGGKLRSGLVPCGDRQQAILEGARVSCVAPDATCPRGTERSGGVCARPPSCPPGTLADARACRPLVTEGRGTHWVVDLGLWTALVLGPDGGPGAPTLCGPLAQRPSLFAQASDAASRVRIRVTIAVPDQDISGLRAEVAARDSWGRSLSTEAESVVTGAVATLVELLRSLGGEANVASIETHVRCEITPK